MDVYLVPIGQDEYALYTEHAEEPERDPAAAAGRLGRLRAWFRELVATAELERRLPPGSQVPLDERSWTQRVRARVLRWVAEAVAEQRLLWHLRRAQNACLIYPADLERARAEASARAVLGRDADRHRIWFIIDGLLFVASGLFVVIPGPNLIAYYFLFRLIGHLLSWRGARHGLQRVAWTYQASGPLAELRAVVPLSAAARRERVCDLAAELKLEHLAAFVERTAVPVP